MTKQSRRNLLKGLAVSAPAAWSSPLVTSVILPAHAQTSPCGPSLSCSTDDPVRVSDDTVLDGGGSTWGFNSIGLVGEPGRYEALINELQAQACPGTEVSISVEGQSGDGVASVGTGETVTADGSGAASFSERVRVTIPPAGGSPADPLNFTLRFTSDDGSGPCDIPFCFTEFPAGACGFGKPGP
jgi:hypothetical protein